jgi:DNA-binding MarR family transcriptional regulator
MVRPAQRLARGASSKKPDTAAGARAATASKASAKPKGQVRSEVDFASASPPDNQAGSNTMLFALLLRAGRAIFEKVEAAVARQGESVLTFRPLAIVVRFGPQTQQEIARLTAQHPAGVSRIVDELEARKLVRRVRGEQDRRTIRVEPTAEGRALFERVDPHATGALEAAIGVLDERELAAFSAMLEKIVVFNGT